MSTWATAWAWKQGCNNPAEKLILLALADCADFDACCYPGQKALAEMTHQTDRSVRDHLKHLEARSLLQRTARWRKDGTRTSDVFQLAGGKRPAEKSSGSDVDNRKNTTGQPETVSASPPEKFSGDPDPALILSENLSLTRFDAFWDLYPKKTDRKAAERAWRKLRPSAELTAVILTRLGMAVGIDWRFTAKQYIPNPASWLNGAKWQDEVIESVAPNGHNGTSPANSADVAERQYGTLKTVGVNAKV